MPRPPIGAPIQAKSKNEQVYDYLHARIISCQIAPGSRLVVDHLARELGVSQIPIREAIFRLEADGFVRTEPHVGATVTELHAGTVREVFGLLEAMEVISGRAACEQLSDAELQQLEQRVAEMEALTDDPQAWATRNKELHQLLCEKTGLPLIGKLMREVLDHWERLRTYYLDEVSARRVPDAQREHREILQALQRRDADRLEQLVREHNRRALAAYIDHLEQRGELAASKEAP